MRFRVLILALVLAAIACVSAPPARADRVRPADRREINRLLDRFVPAAVRRLDTLGAARMVTPNLKSDTTRAEWKRGDIPVYPYPARGTRFHGWTVSYVEPREIGISLFLQPRRGARAGPIAFDVTLKEIKGRWLIDSFLPGAVYTPSDAPPRINAPVDVGPGGGGNAPTGPRRLGALWLVVPFAVLGLAAALALGFPLVRWQRERCALRSL